MSVNIIVEEWAKKSRETIIRNLRNRKAVANGRFILVSDVKYNIIRANEEQIEVEFKFDRSKAIFDDKSNTVKDPLFRRSQPVEFQKSKFTQFKSKNIYTLLQRRLFDRLVADLIPEYTELAQRIIINIG